MALFLGPTLRGARSLAPFFPKFSRQQLVPLFRFSKSVLNNRAGSPCVVDVYCLVRISPPRGDASESTIFRSLSLGRIPTSSLRGGDVRAISLSPAFPFSVMSVNLCWRQPAEFSLMVERWCSVNIRLLLTFNTARRRRFNRLHLYASLAVAPVKHRRTSLTISFHLPMLPSPSRLPFQALTNALLRDFSLPPSRKIWAS